MKKEKLTALERSWIFYDVGNSAFTLLCSTLLPIYFNALVLVQFSLDLFRLE